MLHLLNKAKGFFYRPQKIDKHTLTTAIDTALAEFGLQDGDTALNELIAQTGKTRGQILETVLNDDEVDACREDLQNAMLAKPYRLWGDGVAEKDINRLLDILSPHIKTFADLAICAKFNGYAVAEYVYKIDNDGTWVIDKVLNKDGELDKFTPKRSGEVLFDDGTKTIVIDQQLKCLVLKSRAVPARPTGEMMILRVYPAVMLRSKSWAYAGQFISRYAQPYLIGKEGEFSQQGDGFLSAIFSLVGGGAAKIGKDDSIDIHQLTADGQAFDMIERLCNRRIQKLILGRVKTSELTSGSRSAQETDDNARTDRIAGYLSLMREAVQHALNAMIAVNAMMGNTSLPAVYFEHIEEKAMDIARAQRDKIYADTGQIRLTKAYYQDVVGYEQAHFEMVDNLPKNQASQVKNLPLSLQLSAKKQSDSHHNHDDDTPLTAKQAQISQTKTDAILSILSDCTDFLDFEKRLQSLALPDGGMIDELAAQNLQSYIDGVAGGE